jgi:hypothetical protein
MNACSEPIPLICPACNKPGQAGPACQRCGCDLAALRSVRRAAETCLARARGFLRDRHWDDALGEAESSWALYHSPEAARMAFVLAAALRDTESALRWYQRVSPRARPGESNF